MMILFLLTFIFFFIKSEDPPSHEVVNELSWKAISDLKPKPIWSKFYNVSRIPRPSDPVGEGLGNLNQVEDYLLKYAKSEGLEAYKDKTGNVVIIVPSHGSGYEKLPPTIIQSHMDQVPATEIEYNHNWLKDPIWLEKDSEHKGWLTAHKTTLGADDGIGIATETAIISERNSFFHPKLYCLFTVDEETTMEGVRNLKKGSSILYDILKDAKYYLNVDSEDEGVMTIGSAGGVSSYISSKNVVEQEKNQFQTSYSITLSGLHGGHSGIEINMEYCNGVQVFSQILVKLREQKIQFSVSDIAIGEKENAIPNKGYVVINFNDKDLSKVKNVISEVYAYIETVYGSVENMKIVKLELKKIETQKMQFIDKRIVELTKLMYLLPTGVIRMMHSEALSKPLVETSTNLASVKLVKGKFYIIEKTRSSVVESALLLQNKIEVLAVNLGFDVERGVVRPAWKPSDKPTFLQKLSSKTYKSLFGSDLESLAIHAGLEAAFVLQEEYYPKLDVISIGPTVRSPHTPQERVDILSVEKYYTFTKQILINMNTTENH